MKRFPHFQLACLLGLTLGMFLVTMLRSGWGAPPPPRGITTSAVLLDWYDGDTGTAELKVRVKLRLLNCWAPEVRGKQRPQGLKSRDFLRKTVPPGSVIRVHIPTTGDLADSFTFGRVLADAWYIDDEAGWVNIPETMVKTGHATKEKKK